MAGGSVTFQKSLLTTPYSFCPSQTTHAAPPPAMPCYSFPFLSLVFFVFSTTHLGVTNCTWRASSLTIMSEGVLPVENVCASRVQQDSEAAVVCSLRKQSYVVRCLVQVDGKGQALEQPLELSFQDQYGNIEKHLWFGDGYILLGFSTGSIT